MKLLYLLPGFPPQGGTYTLRITKHVKYLSKLDLQPTVLVPFESGTRSDESLVEDVPDNCRVHRIQKLNSYIASGFLLKKIWQLTSRNSFDLLVTTAPDDRFIYLGSLITNLFGLDWHCDLREPPRGSGYRGWIKRNLLGRADLITSPWPARYIFPNNIDRRKRIDVIPHGFDPDDFRGESKRSKKQDSHTEILHAGSLFENRRNPEHFFNALESLLGSGEIRKKDVKFHFVGRIKTKRFENRLHNQVDKRGLSEVVQFEPIVNHKQITKRMVTADVCVGFQSTDLLALKIFEYLGSQNPILAYYGSDSPMKEIFDNETGIHWVDYGEEQNLRKTMLELIKGGIDEAPSQDLRDRYNLEKSIVPKLSKLYDS